MIARFKKNSYQWSPLAVALIILLACVSLPDAPRTKASETTAAKPPPMVNRRVRAEPAPPTGANIIWVTSTRDYDLDGVQDDQGFIDWLLAEGHNVDVRIDYWNGLDLEPDKVDELNAADLVIVSRSTKSVDHIDGDEPTLWNSVTTPLITMNGYFARANRWRWMHTKSYENADAIMLAVDPTHPVFDGVTFEMGNMVTFLDNTVGSGKASFVGSIDVGNGTLIAQTLSNNWTWIAEWPAGVEFYAGSGQIAGGPRMLFVAGTQETDPPLTPFGAWNLTAEGEKMLRNAINYMLPAAEEPPPTAGANITWVTSTRDYDLDGVQDDQRWIDWLTAEGHTVDVRIDYWKELDAAKADELNAADLVIISRSVDSRDHCDGDEPTLWNSVTTPLILMNGYIVRSSRWRWMDTTTMVKGDDIMLALDPTHPLFEGVTLEGGNMVIFRDNTVAPGITSFVASIDAGNGTLIARALSGGYAWIAEWPAGVEFYAGSGQFAGGPRMLFVAGTQEEGATPQGAWDLSAEGEKIFRNAIAYMLSPSPEAPAGYLYDGDVALYTPEGPGSLDGT